MTQILPPRAAAMPATPTPSEHGATAQQGAAAQHGATAQEWRARDAAVISTAYGRYSDLVVESAQGAHLRTVDGRDILDLGCGIGVTNLGHNHPAVVAAVESQVRTLWHTSVTAIHPRMIEAAEALVRVAPSGLDRVFWCNSGAEAVEGAIKLARRATGRSEIVAFDGAFHGRTYGALTLTASKARYHAGMGPLLPGVHHIPYPVCATCPRSGAGGCCRAQGEDLERLMATRVDPSDIAAVVVEPVLGEGGYVVPPTGFLASLRRLCDAHGILLVADEVQTGVGRTGRWFGVDHAAVLPDMITVAKGLGNGLPVAALVARQELMEHWHPGDHGTTYGGNAVACAAVSAVLATIERDGLLERTQRLGARALGRADGWRTSMPGLVADVRGLGLMIGIELRRPDGSPAHDELVRVRELALERDVLVLYCGTEENVIRLLPPLTISDDDLDHGLDVLESCLAAVVA